jgi:hypothetical protein
MINSCGENNVTNHFLGGHCKLSSNRVTKIVKNLTDHSYVTKIIKRLEFKLLFIFLITGLTKLLIWKLMD